MSIKKTFYVVAGLAVLAGVIALVMPQERADAIATSFKRSTGDVGILCLDYIRGKLKDPESAKLLDTTVTKQAVDQKVTIRYKAKNSYGAYTTSEESCVFANGKIDESGTKLSHTLDKLAKEADKLEKETVCLEEKMKNRRNGADPVTLSAKFAACMAE